MTPTPEQLRLADSLDQKIRTTVALDDVPGLVCALVYQRDEARCERDAFRVALSSLIEEIRFETLDTDGSYTRIDTTHLEQAIVRAEKTLADAENLETRA